MRPNTLSQAIRPLLQSPWTVYAFTAAALVRHLAFIRNYATNIYWWDQFNFIDPIVRGAGALDAFRWQNGAHRMGLGIWITTLLTPLTKWNAISECYVMTGALLLTTILALRLKRRLLGPLNWQDIYIPACILTINQWAIYVESISLSLSTPRFCSFSHSSTWSRPPAGSCGGVERLS